MTIYHKEALMEKLLRNLLVLLLAASPLAATPIQVGRPAVTDVTIFLEGAEVAREVEVQAPAGESMVEVLRFPAGVDAASVRTSVRGKSASVGSMTITKRTITKDGDVGEIDRQLEALGDQVHELEQRHADAAALRKFLDSAMAAKTRPGTEAAAATELDRASILGLYELLAGRFDELRVRGSERRKEKRRLEQEIADLELKKAEASSKESICVAQVRLQVAQAGTVTLRFAYFAAKAEWAPRYRVSLADDESVELVSEAAVRQWTGDDWSSARLRLSTVRPTPRLSPQYLGEWHIGPRGEAARAAQTAFTIATATPGVLSDRINVGGNESGQQLAFIAPATTDATSAEPAGLERTRTSYSVTFDAPARVAVPGDGQTQQVELWRRRLPATVSYRIKPTLHLAAFLEATVLVPEGAPLLPGQARVYVGDAMLGVHTMPEAAPGEQVILPFGVDNRIAVARRTLETSEQRKGRFDKLIVDSRAFRTTVTNHQQRPIRLVVEDRVPVAKVEQIEVELGERTTGGHEPSQTRRGVLLWKLALEPGESKVVDFEVAVRYPQEMAIEGL